LQIYFAQLIPIFGGISAGIDKKAQNISQKEFKFVVNYFIADLRYYYIKLIPSSLQFLFK